MGPHPKKELRSVLRKFTEVPLGTQVMQLKKETEGILFILY